MLTEAQINEFISTVNRSHINSWKAIRSITGRLDQTLYTILIDQLEIREKGGKGFDVDENGRIKNNARNRLALDRVLTDVEQFFKTTLQLSSLTYRVTFAEIGSQIIEGAKDINKVTGRYFAISEKDAKKLNRAKQKAFEESLREIGIYKNVPKVRRNQYIKTTQNNYIAKSSDLAKAIQMGSVRDKISDAIQQGITRKLSFAQVVRNTKKLFEGKNGLIGDRINRFIFDKLQEAKRTQAASMANSLGYEFARYAGTERKGSRPKCKGGYDEVAKKVLPRLINCIHHISEIIKLGKGKWEGKIKNQTADDFIRLCAGYNCYHVWVWLPTTYVLARDPSMERFLKAA